MAREVLDITDENDCVIGTRTRLEIALGELRNIRVVAGFLVNQDRKLWIPRRTSLKNYCPSCLDMSFGGYVQSGEDYDQSFSRELREELNIDSDSIEYVRLGKLSPYETAVSSFTMVYVVYVNDTPQFNPEDFSEGFWMAPEELIEKLNNGEPAKSDLRVLVEQLTSSIIYRNTL